MVMKEEKQEKKDNVLVYKEKPYHTRDELRLYYGIAIDEARKHGDREMATHYKILLDYLDNYNEEEDEFKKFILGTNKKK